MTFTNDYNSFIPRPFPLNDYVGGNIVAPFWADADSTMITKEAFEDGNTGGVVFYQVYSDNSNQSRQIYDLATKDGRKYISPMFTADWVLVVTWNQVVPYPQDVNMFSSEVGRMIMLKWLYI